MRRDRVDIQALYVRVGAAIRALRQEDRLSSADLAERLGVTARNMQRYETAEVPIPLHVLVAFADEFDTSLDELIPVLVDERKSA